MNKTKMGIGLLMGSVFLSGCAGSLLDNNDARCPFKDRGGCQSMEMVNRMVTEKRYTPDGQFVQQMDQATFYARKNQEK